MLTIASDEVTLAESGLEGEGLDVDRVKLAFDRSLAYTLPVAK
jgi:hypothetical protein